MHLHQCGVEEDETGSTGEEGLLGSDTEDLDAEEDKAKPANRSEAEAEAPAQDGGQEHAEAKSGQAGTSSAPATPRKEGYSGMSRTQKRRQRKKALRERWEQPKPSSPDNSWRPDSPATGLETEEEEGSEGVAAARARLERAQKELDEAWEEVRRTAPN